MKIIMGSSSFSKNRSKRIENCQRLQKRQVQDKLFLDKKTLMQKTQ